MPDTGIIVKVHSGSDVVFSTFKHVAETNAPTQRNAAILVQSLKELKVEVNNFLTELVVQSGNQNQNSATDNAGDDEEGEEEDADDDDDGSAEEDKETLRGSLNTKRKLHNIASGNGSKIKKAE